MNLDKLKAQLLTSGLQQKDPALFQIINTLIGELKTVIALVASGEVGGSGDSTYLTSTNELTDLPNSRRLEAGIRISFDDAVGGVRTINSDEPTFIEWDVLTNGDAINPEAIFVNGEVIMVHTP